MRRIVYFIALCAVLLFPRALLAAQPSVGVLEFSNTSGAAWWSGGVGWDLSGMLSNELSNTGSFQVVERKKLQSVLSEQNLNASGRVNKSTGAKIGQLIGAKYLVTANVSAFERNVQDTGGGISYKGISIGGKKDKAYIAVDLRVINSTTGAISYSRTVEARSGGGGLKLGLYRGGFGGNLKNEKRTPVGKAIRAVVVEITNYLECAMVTKGSCMSEFDAKERKRKASLSKGIQLD